MRKPYFLLLCIAGLVSCAKQEEVKQPPFSGAEEIKIPEVQERNDEPVKDPLEGKSVQEIIQSYDGTMALGVALEGNFTNSGNREIVGFYQKQEWEETPDNDIDAVYCFVLNADETKVEHIYPIDYWTFEFRARDEADTGLSSVLGRDVVWFDRRIGCTGDFNGNGREELYLFRLSGLGMDPIFLEFDQAGAGFVEILECNRNINTLVIKDIDAEQKIIFLEEITQFKSTLPNQYWYRWDENIQRYTALKENVYPYIFDTYTLTWFKQYPETITEFKEKYQGEILDESISAVDPGSPRGTKSYTFVLKGRQFIFHGETEEDAELWKVRIEDVSVQNDHVQIIGMNVSDLKRLINRTMDYQESETGESSLEMIINNQYTADYYLVIGTENDTVIRYDLIKKE
jgi:hypothetical protein